MDKNKQNALSSFMRLVLNELHPNIEEYPLKEIEQIDMFEGDESDKLLDMPSYAVNAFYMKKAINIIANN